jgi:phosphohistidine swiveling domain-containing protein
MIALKNIDSIRKKDKPGNKALSLYRMKKAGLRIPRSFLVPDAFRVYYKENPPLGKAALKAAVEQQLNSQKYYAVRSSSIFEDQEKFSFAGQFETFLNVPANGKLIDAIEQVWKSSEQGTSDQYKENFALKVSTNTIGVIVQEMVNAIWSGVGFSIHPVTGRKNLIIEAVKGSGENLVQKGHTPHRWVWNKGAWEGPEGDNSPGKEVLNQLRVILNDLPKIWKTEVDVEWACSGDQVFVLQCRSVTIQQYPAIYANHISREVLPGLIKPLVWSVNIPLVNSAWIRLLERLLGKLDIEPEQLSYAFYYRAYFNMGTLGTLFEKLGMPANALERLMGNKDPEDKGAFKPGLKTFRYLPRMLWFVITLSWLGREFRKQHHKMNGQIEYLESQLQTYDPADFNVLKSQLMKLGKHLAYYNILVPIVMRVINALLKKRTDKSNIKYEDLNFSADFPELRNYDPQYELRRLNLLWEQKGGDAPEFQKGFKSFLDQFGHFSESGNDFSYPQWQEEPEFVIQLIKNAVGERRSRNKKNPEISTPSRGLYRWAGKFRVYREMISSQYTRGYGLFRTFFLQTGQFLCDRQVIQKPEDIFYLKLEELETVLTPGTTNMPNLLEEVEARQKELQTYQEVSLPSIIYGETPPPVITPQQKEMKGIPTSPGTFKGKTVVVKGYDDFSKSVEGAILIIPFSDVGWTPILSRAGGIVSESGGILSHASIVARELGIPSISSVDHVCNLEDGLEATLDAYNGILIIEDNNT